MAKFKKVSIHNYKKLTRLRFMIDFFHQQLWSKTPLNLKPNLIKFNYSQNFTKNIIYIFIRTDNI